MKRVSKTRTIAIVGLALALAVLTGVVAYFEPFASRFEGKTVNQWLDYHSKNTPPHIHIDVKVIDGFGTNAFKSLLDNRNIPFWLKSYRKIHRQFGGNQSPIFLRRSAKPA